MVVRIWASHEETCDFLKNKLFLKYLGLILNSEHDSEDPNIIILPITECKSGGLAFNSLL